MALPLRVIYMNQNHVAIETFGRKEDIQVWEERWRNGSFCGATAEQNSPVDALVIC